ncbi:hypothetical protein ACQPXB_21255 [Amycolatopsis sp. CA-161197]|uniref:hypothetical protein n=1 Tax=Amycolatopsis sp. CA-161197 TaxID=3239922 RepID=UPI003D909BAB
MTAGADGRAARRARTRLIVAAMAFIAVVAIVASLVVDHYRTASPTAAPTPVMIAPSGVGRDAAAEQALATRLMVWLPASAAQPHALAESPGAPIIVPTSATGGPWIPAAFPLSPEGALAQLVALDEAGVNGGDPDTYARAYAELAVSGAPPVAESGLYTVLARFRQAAGLSAGEVRTELAVRYEVTEGLIKGTADGGRYVVACVLGELSTDVHGYGARLGVGDCQAMLWAGSGWRISDGPRAAYAASAWPGTAEAAGAGYRLLAGVGR